MTRYATKTMLFYGTVGVFLVVLITDSLSMVLPDGLAGQIGNNSEALAFVLPACAAIQGLRPATKKPGNGWATAGASAFACFVVAYVLRVSDLPDGLVTLNESFFAAGTVILYMQLPRPGRAVAPLISGLVLIGIAAFFETTFVTRQAESLILIAIAPLSLDIIDRGLVERGTSDVGARRVILWCGSLATFGVAIMLLARQDLSGSVGSGLDFAQRASEAYWAWMLVHLYFSFWLRPDWLSRRSVGQAKGAAGGPSLPQRPCGGGIPPSPAQAPAPSNRD